MTGSGLYADLIRQRALVARRRFGLDRKHIELDCTRFAPPTKTGDQLRLF